MSDVEKPEVEEAVAGSANGEDANREAPDPTTGYAPLKFKDPMELSFLAPLPYNITIHSIPNIGETRGIWRTGMQTLEQTFAQVIQQMTMEFDSKLVEFERVRNEIVANHDFLTQWYKDMQRKLNEKNDQILLERQKWEAEKAEIKGMINMDSEVVALNVGGTHHLMTERDVLTLCKGSILEKMFNGMHDLKKVNDEVFLDRDGRTFLHLVNYLRNDREVFPDFMDRNDEIHFFKELDFWKIPTKYHHVMSKKVEKQHQGYASSNQIPAQQVKPTNYASSSSYNVRESNSLGQVRQIPVEETTDVGASMVNDDSQGVALKAAKDKWNELGPLRLDDIVANSKIPIDQSMKFGQSKYNKYIIGQLAPSGKVTGVGKEINHIIYEGQFIDDVYNGYGRFIYSNGNYYIGNWVDGKRSGYGKLVDKNGKVYEGQWQYSKYMGP